MGPHAFQKTLTLPDAKPHIDLFGEIILHKVTVPVVPVIASFARRSTEIRSQRVQLAASEPGRTPGARIVAQCVCAGLSVRTDPSLDGARRFSKPMGHFGATVSLINQQHAMQPMHVPGLFSTQRLLLQNVLQGVPMEGHQSFHEVFPCLRAGRR